MIFSFLTLGITACGSTQTAANATSVSQTVTSSQAPTAPQWNLSNLDVASNGNMAVAVQLIHATTTPPVNATTPSPAAVFIAPWKYYGKWVEITGVAGIVQDYPPGSPASQAFGGAVSEVVIVSSDGTYTDYFMLGTTGSIRPGASVDVFGYPVGQDHVTNKLGGTTTQLVVVGNKIQTPVP